MKSEEKDAIVLNLKPEAHDKKMEELLSILLERGIKNALDIVEKLDDPHIDDDFHRFWFNTIFPREMSRACPRARCFSGGSI